MFISEHKMWLLWRDINYRHTRRNIVSQLLKILWWRKACYIYQRRLCCNCW